MFRRMEKDSRTDIKARLLSDEILEMVSGGKINDPVSLVVPKPPGAK